MEEVKVGNKMVKARQYPWGTVQGNMNIVCLAHGCGDGNISRMGIGSEFRWPVDTRYEMLKKVGNNHKFQLYTHVNFLHMVSMCLVCAGLCVCALFPSSFVVIRKLFFSGFNFKSVFYIKML
jgi:hypothetical protein